MRNNNKQWHRHYGVFRMLNPRNRRRNRIVCFYFRKFEYFRYIDKLPYNGFDYTHHIVMTYCIDIISDSEKEISEYVNDRSGSVENDSLGYKWISIDSFCEKNASPLVIKVCELINNKKSFEIIEYVI